MKPSVECRSYSVPRTGADSSEDAAAVRANAWPLRVAVADGATESVYAGRWAEMLAEGGVAIDATPEATGDALPRWQERWAAAVGSHDDRPWYVEAKAREGAFATLLVLEVGADHTWRAVSIGDCGLLHLRDGTLHRAWPTDDPDAFTTRPALLPSRPDRPVPAPDTTTGAWAPGDAFVLATDAVAAWLLRTDPARVLDGDPDAFRDAVQTARTDGALRNDDATFVVLEMDRRKATGTP